MTAYLLDTNHLSPLVTLNHPLRTRILAELAQGHQFALTIVALSEMLYGISLLPRAEQNLAEWERLSPQWITYLSDETDAKQAAKLRVLLRRQGRQLEAIDALIAVVAIRYDLVLLTTDRDFEAVPLLKRANWLK